MPEKQLLQDTRGIKVYAVDGKKIRDGRSVAFSGGENWMHDPELPKNEIWIENPKDLKGILLHELIEAKLMEDLDLEYDEAHLVANVSEGFYRKTEDLDTVLETLKSATGLQQDAIDLIKDVMDPTQVKKAAFDDMPWVTAGRQVPNEAPESDPYQAYLRDVLGSGTRRQRFFDVAGGTRSPGLTGALGGHGRAVTVGQELFSAGINPLGQDTPEGFSRAFRTHLGDPKNVEGLFGAQMNPTDALATLGPLGVLTASRDAGDPQNWAKAFGTGAKTPEEQQKIRRRLHAAMTLHATKQALKNLWNTSRLGEVFGKTPVSAIGGYPRAPKTWEVGPEGWQAAPRNPSEIPVLDPKYFPDNEEAARVAAKYGSFDKYARDLNGDWPTAKDPHDKEDHLYHTVKKDGHVVGMVKVKPHVDGFMVSNLWVRPSARSGGVGTSLMQRVLKHYGDHKLYLTAEIFDNSPITQDQLETWYKKFGFVGSHQGKMTRPANTKVAAEDTRPYRNRVEIFAVNDAKIPKVYGGKFSTGGFGVFGGGTDGDELVEAAKREFLEETGYKLTEVEKIPVDPVTVEWLKPYKSEKQAERAKTYRGTRTWYIYGVIEGEKAEKASGDDGKAPLSDVGFYTINTAMKMLVDATTENTELRPQIEARKRALLFVLAKAYGIGLTKVACEVPQWAKKNKKLLEALTKKLKKTAGGRDAALNQADASVTLMLEILGRQGDKPAKTKRPRRIKHVHEVLHKHAAALGRLVSRGAKALSSSRPSRMPTEWRMGASPRSVSEITVSGFPTAAKGPLKNPYPADWHAADMAEHQRQTAATFARRSPGAEEAYGRMAVGSPRVRLPTPRALQIHGQRLGNQARRAQGLQQTQGTRRLALGAAGAGTLAVGGALAAGMPGSPAQPQVTPWAGPNAPESPWWAGPSQRSPAAANVA